MILLTRPYEDSTKVAEILGENNCLIEPVIAIKKLDIDLEKYIKNEPQAIVITSNNAPNINIWPITIKIPENGKNGEEILSYCKQNFKPDGGKILYLSGDPVALDIAAELEKDGFDAERIITYKQIPQKEFSENFLHNISKVKTATFFSSYALNVFAELINRHGLQDKLKEISCITLSNKIAEEAHKLNWKDVQACSRPNQESMIRRICNPLLDS